MRLVRNRCRIDIVADVLYSVVEEGSSRISRIASMANLPLDRARPLVEDLVEKGLLTYRVEESVYEATDRAYEWLSLYRFLREVYDWRKPHYPTSIP